MNKLYWTIIVTVMLLMAFRAGYVWGGNSCWEKARGDIQWSSTGKEWVIVPCWQTDTGTCRNDNMNMTIMADDKVTYLPMFIEGDEE